MKRVVFGAWRFLAGLATPSKARNLRRLRARGEDPDAFRVREASATDVPALTWLHVTTWNATYAPLLMKGPSYNVRERQWREVFAKKENGWFCFVVERPDGDLVAFAQGRVWIRLGARKIDSDPGTGNYGWHDLAKLAAFPDSTDA